MIKYTLIATAKFKRGLKRYKNDKDSLEKIKQVLNKLANDEKLEIKHKDHALKGEFVGFRDCHIKPDLLLIYQEQATNLLNHY